MAVAAWPALCAELEWLNARVAREILRLRARYQLSLDEFRGLYISDEQVDELIAGMEPRVHDPHAPLPAWPLSEDDAEGAPVSRVARALGLDAIERAVVLLAIAPEIDLKYETLYAYLNDDVTRRWPTVDLAERLLADDRVEPHAVRSAFRADGRLCADGVVRRIEPPGARPSSLNFGFAAGGPIVHAVVGIDGLPQELAVCCERRREPVEWDDVPVTARLRATLMRLPALVGRGSELPLFILAGEPGAAFETAVGGVATALEMPVIACDLQAARAAGMALGALGATLALHLQLDPSALLLTNTDAPDIAADRDLQTLVRRVRAASVPVFAAGARDAPWHRIARGVAALTLAFDAGAFGDRAELWRRAASSCGVTLADGQADELASRFDLSPRDMEATVASARDLAIVDGRRDRDAPAYLSDAARRRVSHELGALGVKIDTRCGWDALVLPDSTVSRLHELAAAIRCRHQVFDAWGFGERTTTGVGVRALFAGPSGTGKTMTASVIARELTLDLYRIDLSSVVSKYIGETEKNLDRIFRAVRGGHVLLFFDEADALFGKRSEVKDAHDRYANIEVAFLLQRLEDHDGAVILATNLRRNLDDAFARRMQFVIEFPPPHQAERERLWRVTFPPAAPLADDLDFAFLARQFEFAGGDIRNVALDAAFQAAETGGPIAMCHIVRALARQLAKEGKSPSPSAFHQYYALLG